MAQIHELNTFAGTLGAGAYLAIDDGTDTGKISSQSLLAATEARIDNIIAGPAPSAEEIVDARLGADGVTYPSLGDAIRDQNTDVKSALELSEDGISTFRLFGSFQHYGLNPDGTFLTTQTYRVSNDDPMTFDRNIEVHVKSGFRWGYIPFVNGVPGSWVGWITDTRVMPKDTSFVVQIARVTENISEIADVIEFTNAITFSTLISDKITSLETAVDLTKAEINDLTDEYISKNLFDTSGSTEGKYLNPSNGVPSTNASWAYTDFIAVESSTDYILSYDNARIDNTQPYYFYCWYDSTKTYVSGGTKSGTASAITSPSNAQYVKISYEKDKAPYIQFEKGATKTDYINYYDVTKIDPSRIDTTNIGKTVIRIDDSYSLRSVFDSISPNEHNQYLIELEEGEYDTLNGFSAADKAKAGFIGLIVPNWTTLKGIGDKADVVLYATLDTANQNISALNMKGSASLFNLTVKGTKTRYAVHDDFGYSDDVCIRAVGNCDFIARQCYYGAAYGSGVRSGAVWKFKDCIFDADTSNPFVLHSQNATFAAPADVTLENCTMKAKGLMGMRVGGMSSGVINRLHLIGCNLFGIYVAEEIANSGSGIDWKIDGYGNTPAMLQRFVATDGNQYYAEFSDEMQYFKAQANISKYDAIYRVGAGCAVAANNNKTPCGIALADASSGDLVPVKIRGSFDMTDYGLTLALGDLVKLSNSALVVDNNATQFVGICNNADQYISMKLAGLMMI